MFSHGYQLQLQQQVAAAHDRASEFVTAQCLHLALTSHRDAHLALLPAVGLLAAEGHLWTGIVIAFSQRLI